MANLQINFLGVFMVAIFSTITTVGPGQAAPTKIRFGVLAYGTVNWDLDTVAHHDLDKPEGEAIEMLRLDLLKRHPQLLSGLIESDDKSGKEIVL